MAPVRPAARSGVPLCKGAGAAARLVRPVAGRDLPPAARTRWAAWSSRSLLVAGLSAWVGRRGPAPHRGRRAAALRLAARQPRPGARHRAAVRARPRRLVGLPRLQPGYRRHREADGVRLHQRRAQQPASAAAGPLALGLRHQLLLLRLRHARRADPAHRRAARDRLQPRRGDVVRPGHDVGVRRRIHAGRTLAVGLATPTPSLRLRQGLRNCRPAPLRMPCAPRRLRMPHGVQAAERRRRPPSAGACWARSCSASWPTSRG